MDDFYQDGMPLKLAVKLFQTLKQQGIGYCHWKSNANLDRSLKGLSDFDLLVDRSHSRCFREILYQFDFKPAIPPAFRQYPAMEDYLGFDRESGRLIHLHVHYQLILGEKFIKNYHLPLERSFLETNHTYEGIKIPAPELEIIVLSIRTLLKYRDRDFIKSLLPINSRKLPGNVIREFEYLLNQTSMELIADVLESKVDFISRDLVLESLKLILSPSTSGYALYRQRGRLRREISPYQRNNRIGAFIRYFYSSVASSRRILYKRLSPPKMRMIPGGMTIAVIGADGAGKSTIITQIYKWLSWKLTVRTYYMGSAQKSRLTRITGWFSKFFGFASRKISGIVGEKNILSRLFFKLKSNVQHLYLLAKGKDRYSRYLAGQKMASRGALVLFDRYPLEAVRIDGGFMDGPRIASVHQLEMGPITKALSKIEQNIYRKIRPPDHLFLLVVSPIVSSQRKPDHKLEKLEAKIQSLENMVHDGLCITHINADQPMEQALLQIKTALWELL